MFATSGDRQLDRALIAELRKVCRVFGINPGFQYLDDSSSPNAYATTDTYISNTKGTVLFGLGLVNSEIVNRYGGAAVAGIAAHEGSHIFQFYSTFLPKLQSGSTARPVELHADYLAGYYFKMTGRTEKSIESFGASLRRMGDFDFSNPSHHGTPDERVRAMLGGYKAGEDGLDRDQASDRGIDYVT
ncbi:MAG TPA: hypothetical protein VNX29_09960 [Kaistia sp.]|nr:hypothetical protein [Kaistia sp.]